MAHIITTLCERDGSCMEVCPVDAISAGADTDPQYYIDPDACIDCGACAAECPVSAIFADDELPEEYAASAEVNANFFK